MTYEEAIHKVSQCFPFQGYLDVARNPACAHANIVRTVLRYLPPGGKILDFGCGPCDKTAALQFLGYQCSGYDDLGDGWAKIPENRAKILDFIRRCGVDFHLAADSGLPFEPQSFDMVMSHDVLEHLHDSPRDLLNDLLGLTKPGGLLFITVPNLVNIRKRIAVVRGRTNMPSFDDFYWHPGPWRGHTREYVKGDLAALAQFLNLEVLELRGCDHMIQKVPPSARSLYLLVTKLFSGWKDSWLLVARKRVDWAPKKTLPQEELAAILAKNRPQLSHVTSSH